MACISRFGHCPTTKLPPVCSSRLSARQQPTVSIHQGLEFHPDTIAVDVSHNAGSATRASTVCLRYCLIVHQVANLTQISQGDRLCPLLQGKDAPAYLYRNSAVRCAGRIRVVFGDTRRPQSQGRRGWGRVAIRLNNHDCPGVKFLVGSDGKAEFDAIAALGVAVSSHGTIPQIKNLANVRLVELSRAKGWAGANLENCDVGIAQVKKFKDLRKAAAHSMDAGKFADHFRPRVMRGRAGLQPMEIVMGDVHPVDILNKREDGSEATARMVSWLDLATNRVFYTLFLFEKGRSVTQAHIAYSFVQMVREWGLPSILYLDNGSEYIWKEMMEGFERLTLLVNDFRAYCMNSADLEQRIEQADSEDAELGEDSRDIWHQSGAAIFSIGAALGPQYPKKQPKTGAAIPYQSPSRLIIKRPPFLSSPPACCSFQTTKRA